MTLVVSVIISMVAGGFKIGSLERTMEVVIPTVEMSSFLERAIARLAELGFHQSDQPWVFQQGGKSLVDGFVTNVENAGSTPHAKSRKRLHVLVQQDAEATRVQVMMKYLDFVTGDSGESAYRDAVLDYVSGRIDAMPVIRNRSTQAVSSLATGIVMLCAPPIMLPRFGFGMTLILILLLGVTNMFFSVVAVVSISRNRQELSGLGYAISGILVTILAVVLVIILGILNV